MNHHEKPPFWRRCLELLPSPPEAEDAEAAKGLLKTLSPASSLLQLSVRDPRDFWLVVTPLKTNMTLANPHVQ